MIIPSDDEGNLHVSVSSVLRRHPNLDAKEIIVVSRRLSKESVRESLRRLTFVEDRGDFSFARSVNLGFLVAGERDVVVMGDDVELVSDGGFDLLQEEAPLRILACAVRGRVGPWWQREGQEHPEVPFVSFVCVYLPAQVIRMVGPLEEAFPGYGYEDTDYCLRARRMGLSCGVSRVLVEHGVALKSAFATVHKGALPEMESRARQAFEEKWRSLPHEASPPAGL